MTIATNCAIIEILFFHYFMIVVQLPYRRARFTPILIILGVS
jgi:hypothetical protein